MAKIVRSISENGGVVVCAVDSTDIVREMECIHHPSAVITAALGRLLTAGSLMGAMLKSRDDQITLRVQGGGPAGTLLVTADSHGNVKGYAQNPIVEELPPRGDGKLNVGAAVGSAGSLYVIKDLGMKEPYVGQVPLVSGEIAEDITSYYAVSEQIPTVCALGVLVGKDLTVLKAGGYLLQLLPGATEEEIEHLEKNIAKVPSVTHLLEEGKTVYDLIEIVLEGFNPNVLDEEAAVYHCDCSVERVERALLSLGRAELEAMREEEDEIEVCCQFCDKKYHLRATNLLKQL